MIFIPPPHHRGNKPATQHDTTVGMFVVAILMLGISLVLFIVGPRSNNPPPPLLGYVMVGIAVLFGFIAFFSWMKEQGDGADGADRNHANPES